MLSKVVAVMLLSILTAAAKVQEACPAGMGGRLLRRELEETAIITNGVVKLGLFDTGNLNVDGGTNDFYGETGTGLRHITDWGKELEAVAVGCFCEGWGASANVPYVGSVSGYASLSTDDGANDLTVESFVYDYSTAKTVNKLTDYPLKVSHYFEPAPETDNLYRITVTYTNQGSKTLSDLRYRRVVDWDIPPNEFDECVSINTGSNPDVLYASDDGFLTANPLGRSGFIDFECDGPGCEVLNNGPTDHGAYFDFQFKDDYGSLMKLAPWESLSFYIYYGAAPTRGDVLGALKKVGAEAYSYADACPFRDGNGDVTAAYALGYARTLCNERPITFVVWDVATSEPVGPLGGEINMCHYPKGVSIEAVVPCGDVNKVRMNLQNSRGKSVYKATEGNVPYQLGTDIDTPYRVKPVAQFTDHPGWYKLSVTVIYNGGLPRKKASTPKFNVKGCW